MQCNPDQRLVRAKRQRRAHTHTPTHLTLSVLIQLFSIFIRLSPTRSLPRANLIIKESRQLKHSHGSERSILHAMIMRSLVMPPSCGKVQLGGELGTRRSLSGTVSHSSSFIDRQDMDWLGRLEPGIQQRRERLLQLTLERRRSCQNVSLIADGTHFSPRTLYLEHLYY